MRMPEDLSTEERHQVLDLIVAQFIRDTEKLPSRTSVLELMTWHAVKLDKEQRNDSADD